MANDELDKLAGWNLSADFGAPTALELELELALGSDSWLSLQSADKLSLTPRSDGRLARPAVDPPTRSRRPRLRIAKA